MTQDEFNELLKKSPYFKRQKAKLEKSERHNRFMENLEKHFQTKITSIVDVRVNHIWLEIKAIWKVLRGENTGDVDNYNFSFNAKLEKDLMFEISNLHKKVELLSKEFKKT